MADGKEPRTFGISLNRQQESELFEILRQREMLDAEGKPIRGALAKLICEALGITMPNTPNYRAHKMTDEELRAAQNQRMRAYRARKKAAK